MNHPTQSFFQHPQVSRRTALQAGAVGLLGLGSNHLQALQAASSSGRQLATGGTAKSVIYIFLSGGLSQHESFDLKPEAPDSIRGEFKPIQTKTPGIEISEHLPLLAERSEDWSVVRSLTHNSNDHTRGHYYMLTGRSIPSPGLKGDREPRTNDWPSIASIVGDAVQSRNNNLPPSIVLPEKLIHWSGGVIPGAYGGMMGRNRDPFFIEASPYGDPFWRGAYPEYTFPNHEKKPPSAADARVYQAPNLKLAQGMNFKRLNGRLSLLNTIDDQRTKLEQSATTQSYDRYRESVISLLSDDKVRQAFDVTNAEDKTVDRYGRNSFGWSLLMASRLVKSGVNLVQVNLGNNETWDQHGEIFPRLKDKLFPPTDKALSALLDDLKESGLLDEILIVMAGEFGRTPKLSLLKDVYYRPGRDHWGAVQSVFFAGGGVRGGTVIGSSDQDGAYPETDPQTPDNMAATIYDSLGIPRTAAWYDESDRPFHIYHGEPIKGLM